MTRVAVVTGAGSGIGAALCLELAQRGYHIVAADLDEAAANATVARVLGVGASYVTSDGRAHETVVAMPRRTARPRASSGDATTRRTTARVDATTALAAPSVGTTAMRVDVADAAATSGDATAMRVDVTDAAATSGDATAMRVDVTDAAAVERLAAETCERFGRVDLWINNAGIAIGGATDALSLDDWRRVLDVNLAGVVHGVHAIYPRMLARRSGHIVNVASVAGLAPYPLALPYTTSKHAVVGLSQALRAEARAHDVRVSVACPGMIRTPIWERSEVRGDLARGRAKLLSRIGMMTAEQCAAAILRGIDANHGVIAVTAEARAAWLLNRVSPALANHVSSRLASLARRLAG